MIATVAEREGPALVTRLADAIGARASASTIFGEPVSRGSVTVIPVASVAWGFGGGGGAGSQPTDTADRPTGSGGGGGGGARVRPAGYIVVSDRGARYRPIRRAPHLIALGLSLLGGVAAGALARGRSRR